MRANIEGERKHNSLPMMSGKVEAMPLSKILFANQGENTKNTKSRDRRLEGLF